MLDRRVVGCVVASVVAFGALSACGTGEPAQPAAESNSDLPSGVPSPPLATPPSTESGPLDQTDLPTPETLGKGWEYRIDPGSVEDGYSGSGAPAIARDPAEVVNAITPLGCKPAKQLPMPKHALEVTYQKGSTQGVGLLLEFIDEQEAATFFEAHTSALRDCAKTDRVIAQVTVDEPTRFVSVRKPGVGKEGAWIEGIHVDGTQILLVALSDPAASAAVARALH